MAQHGTRHGDGTAPEGHELTPGDRATRTFVRLFAALGLLAVMAGAFGAHALGERMSDSQLETWKTGAHYHLVHAAVGLAASLAGVAHRSFGRAALASLAVGIVIFAGTLYLLGLDQPRILGAITPIGGLAMMLGWLLLAIDAGGVGRRD